MRKVLIVVTSYLPGYKSGGPQRTIENVCELYSKQCEIYLYTLNHDHCDYNAYDLPVNKWINCYGIQIQYVKDKDYRLKSFKNLYKEFDYIYACSLFAKSTYELILIHKFTKDKKKLYVAPMGVLGEGALSSKSIKKYLFLNAFSALGAFKPVIWTFTSQLEYIDAQKNLGNGNINSYIVTNDLPKKYDWKKIKENIKASDEGELRILFLSRIVPHKNLMFCIDALKDIYEGRIVFDIYGSVENEDYWDLCKEEFSKCLSNIRISYKGEVKPKDTINVFKQYDCFLLPTKGENFGHVIYEALSAGCIPVISDRTPWMDIEKRNCGYIFSLNDRNLVKTIINNLVQMNSKTIVEKKINAIGYAQEKYDYIVTNTGYNEIFLDGII